MRSASFARLRRFGYRKVRGRAVVIVAGILAATALALLLLLFPALADLLATRGELVVSRDDAPTISALGVTPVELNDRARFEDAGLLPLVWRLRDSALGPPLAHWYVRLPILRTNRGALLAIVLAGWSLACVASAILYVLARSIQTVAAKVAGELRKQIYSQNHHLGAGDLFIGQRLSSTDLFTEQVESVRVALTSWHWLFPHAAIFGALMLLLALFVSFWLALATIVSAVICWWLLAQVRDRARFRSALWTNRAVQDSSVLLDRLEHNRVLSNLPSHNSPDQHAFESELARFQIAVARQQTASSGVAPLVALVVSVGLGLVLLLAGYNVLQSPSRLSFADIVLLCSALLATAYPLICIETLLERLPAAEQASADIFTYIDREPRIGQLPDAVDLHALHREIRLEQITLADMRGHVLLDNISCTLSAGQQAVVFSSDEATPRAFAGLLPRFCDPAAGRVLFDGRDLRSATLASVRAQTALILPHNILVSGTIAHNIAGDDERFSLDEIWAAAKKVHAHELIQSLPDGLETVVGPQGLSLSVGQAISIALARTALWRPSVFIIEEPTENLDQATAEQIAAALDDIARDATIVILARRLATLRAAQRILLFHKGQIVDDGTHQELLQCSELYRHLNYVRFNEFRDKVT
jgi:ATP-binding cassette, subfamily B, bacterial